MNWEFLTSDISVSIQEIDSEIYLRPTSQCTAKVKSSTRLYCQSCRMTLKQSMSPKATSKQEQNGTIHARIDIKRQRLKQWNTQKNFCRRHNSVLARWSEENVDKLVCNGTKQKYMYTYRGGLRPTVDATDSIDK